MKRKSAGAEKSLGGGLSGQEGVEDLVNSPNYISLSYEGARKNLIVGVNCGEPGVK